MPCDAERTSRIAATTYANRYPRRIPQAAASSAKPTRTPLNPVTVWRIATSPSASRIGAVTIAPIPVAIETNATATTSETATRTS
jgi:hypothetical protein